MTKDLKKKEMKIAKAISVNGILQKTIHKNAISIRRFYDTH